MRFFVIVLVGMLAVGCAKEQAEAVQDETFNFPICYDMDIPHPDDVTSVVYVPGWFHVEINGKKYMEFVLQCYDF